MKKADHFNEEGFWVGEGGGASGILPICSSTGRIGIALRGRYVEEPGTYGTIGGAIQKGMNPPESAKAELEEETGYTGPIELHPAYVFTKGSFNYFNFLGIVPKEFQLKQSSHSYETAGFEWVTLEDLKNSKYSGKLHFGLKALLKNSKDEIEAYTKNAEQQATAVGTERTVKNVNKRTSMKDKKAADPLHIPGWAKGIDPNFLEESERSDEDLHLMGRKGQENFLQEYDHWKNDRKDWDAHHPVHAVSASKKTTSKKNLALLRIANEEPKELGMALDDLGTSLRDMADKLVELKDSFDLIEEPSKTASIKEAIKYRNKFASSLRRMASEAPEEVTTALNDFYAELQYVEVGVRNLAQNLGIQLSEIEEEEENEGILPATEEEAEEEDLVPIGTEHPANYDGDTEATEPEEQRFVREADARALGKKHLEDESSKVAAEAGQCIIITEHGRSPRMSLQEAQIKAEEVAKKPSVKRVEIQDMNTLDRTPVKGVTPKAEKTKEFNPFL